MLFTVKRPSTNQATTEATSSKQVKDTATAVVYPQLDNHGSNRYSVVLSVDDENKALTALFNAEENLSDSQLIDLYALTKDLQRIGFDTQTGPKYPSSDFPWMKNGVWQNVICIFNLLKI
jgi:hypothetical protein